MNARRDLRKSCDVRQHLPAFAFLRFCFCVIGLCVFAFLRFCVSAFTS